MHDKKDVLILGYLPPPPEGTAKITELILNSELLKSKYNVHFMPVKKNRLSKERGKMNFSNILNNLKNFINLFVNIVSIRPDFVYMPLAQNTFGFLRDSVFALIIKLFRVKLCIHFHGGNFDLFYGSIKSGVFKSYIRFVLNKTDMLILLAGKFKKQFEEFLDTGKMYVLYNCLPGAAGNITARREKDGIITVLYIGLISKAKGALDIVKSAPILRDKYRGMLKIILFGTPIDIEPNITFIDSPNYGYSRILDFIKEHGLENCVQIDSSMDNQRKLSYLESADVFAFTPYSEGCGLVVLEAMSYGIPVITTKVGALEEMLTENVNCAFVEPGDYRSIAESTIRFIENNDLSKTVSANNKDLVRARFNRTNYINNLAEIWGHI